MTKLKQLLAVTFLSVFTSVAAAETKIAVVDFQRALFASNLAKESYKQVEEQFADDIQKGKELQDVLKGFGEKLKKDGAVMSDDEKRKIQNDAQETQADLQFVASKVQKAEQAWNQQFSRASIPLLNKLITEIAEEEKIDMIVRADAAIFAKPDLDITKILLEKLNKVAAEKPADKK